MEHHPKLDQQNLKINRAKIILGSFPIWSLTKHTDEAGNLIDTASEIEGKTGEFPFFYGSSSNLLWKWYREFLDPEIVLLDVKSIQNSLTKNQIGITDVILSCKRKGKSALDKDLFQRVYNHHFFNYPKAGEVLKILCTSKGVMNEMLLSKAFFLQHERVSLNPETSLSFQNEFIERIDGCPGFVKKPILIELNVKDGGVIQCLSTPSPGSPYRRLIDFGYDNNTHLTHYLKNYLSEVFAWLN